MADKGQFNKDTSLRTQESGGRSSDFVLDKVIFSNVFNKDIRRIYLYRKCERLAKALHLIGPAFASTPVLKNRLETVAIGLIDGAILPPPLAKEALSRELLALSSFLAVARSSGLLSEMNANLIIREAHLLLQEVASYEEPRLFLEEAPTLAELAKRAPDTREATPMRIIRDEGGAQSLTPKTSPPQTIHKGHLLSDISTSAGKTERQAAILLILSTKGPSYIKDISTLVRGVSEKTIQRELQALVTAGHVLREGERRWTRYSLVEST